MQRKVVLLVAVAAFAAVVLAVAHLVGSRADADALAGARGRRAHEPGDPAELAARPSSLGAGPERAVVVDVEAEATPETREGILHPTAAEIRCRVLDPDGRPLREAVVLLDYRTERAVDDDARAVFQVTPGTHTLRVAWASIPASLIPDDEVEVSVVVGATATAELETLRAARVAGTVTGGNGVAIEGAHVHIEAVEGGASRSAKTGASGEYAIDRVYAGTYRAEVVGHPGPWVTPFVDLELAEGENRVLDFTLMDRDVRVSGQVVDQYGEPLERVIVDAYRLTEKAFASLERSLERAREQAPGARPAGVPTRWSKPKGWTRLAGAETDRGGGFELDPLPRLPVVLALDTSESLTAWPADLSPRPGPAAHAIDLYPGANAFHETIVIQVPEDLFVVEGTVRGWSVSEEPPLYLRLSAEEGGELGTLRTSIAVPVEPDGSFRIRLSAAMGRGHLRLGRSGEREPLDEAVVDATPGAVVDVVLDAR